MGRNSKLWSAYLDGKSEEDLVALIQCYRGMVHWMTWDDYEGYQQVEQEELFLVGMEAVYLAIRSFDVSKSKNEDSWVSMVVRRKQQNFFNLAQNRSCIHVDVDYTHHADEDVQLDPTLEEKSSLAVPVWDNYKDIDLENAIEKLSPKERFILRLRYWRDWQLKEIASLFGCSKVNIYYHEQRALKKLSALL